MLVKGQGREYNTNDIGVMLEPQYRLELSLKALSVSLCGCDQL